MGMAMFQATGQQFLQNIWTSSQSSVTPLVGSGGAITSAAYSILSVILILGVYEAFAKGGGMRDLVMLGVKVAACGFLISQWTTFFTDITTNGSFALANSISGNDFYTTLQTTITNMVNLHWGSLSFSNIGQDAIEAVDLVAIGIAMLLYWAVYYVMIFAFTAWGLILMAIGPLLVASLPSSLVSSYGSQYLKGLVQWLSWPVLYSVMGALVQGLQSNTTWTPSATATTNTNDLTLTGVTIAYSVALVSIPWMAHHIINGDFARSIGDTITRMDPSGSGKQASKTAEKTPSGDSSAGGGSSEGGSASVGPPSSTPPSGNGGSSAGSGQGVSAPGASPAAAEGAAGGAASGVAGVAEAAPAAAAVVVL
jgi:hypothetical protein